MREVRVIAGFQSRDTLSAWWSTQMETQLSDQVYHLLYVLTLFLVASVYNLAKFAQVHKAESGNKRKVDYQALSYIKILSKTQLYSLSSLLRH